MQFSILATTDVFSGRGVGSAGGDHANFSKNSLREAILCRGHIVLFCFVFIHRYKKMKYCTPDLRYFWELKTQNHLSFE